jgi:hypothetical protein
MTPVTSPIYVCLFIMIPSSVCRKILKLIITSKIYSFAVVEGIPS